MRKLKQLCIIFLMLCLFFAGCDLPVDTGNTSAPASTKETATLTDIPEYSGKPYITIHDNQPDFTDADLTTEAFENYSDLDESGTMRSCLCEYLHGSDADRGTGIHQPGKTKWMAFRKI